MKKVLTSILLISFCAHTFYTTGLHLWFKLNQSHVIDLYCVNKYKPALHCNGHCYLGKQMEKAEKETQEKAEQLFKQWILCKTSLPRFLPCSFCLSISTPPFLPFKTSLYDLLKENDIFHPPLSPQYS